MVQRVDNQTKSGWEANFPVTGSGELTSKLAYQVIDLFFANRNRTIGLDELAIRTHCHQDLLEIMCRQLRLVHILVERPLGSREFQYNLDNADRDNGMQALVERTLADRQDSYAWLRLPDWPGRSTPPDFNFQVEYCRQLDARKSRSLDISTMPCGSGEVF